MAKRALCVGINDYPFEGNDLQGCVNDANAWAALLIDHFDFAPADVRILLDSEATKTAILSGLDELIAGGEAGDVLVFTNSSHGTYLTDESGDEPDRYDEALCPYDCDTNLIIDDELRARLNAVKPGVSFTIISDSCHSGTVTKALLKDTPDQRRVRFLNPKLLKKATAKNIYALKPAGKKTSRRTKVQDLLLSGCKSSEYSFDALIDGAYHGAMTYYALKAITEAEYRITFAELKKQVNAALRANGYNQHPQLEGKTALKNAQIFAAPEPLLQTAAPDRLS